MEFRSFLQLRSIRETDKTVMGTVPTFKRRLSWNWRARNLPQRSFDLCIATRTTFHSPASLQAIGEPRLFSVLSESITRSSQPRADSIPVVVAWLWAHSPRPSTISTTYVLYVFSVICLRISIRPRFLRLIGRIPFPARPCYLH